MANRKHDLNIHDKTFNPYGVWVCIDSRSRWTPQFRYLAHRLRKNKNGSFSYQGAVVTGGTIVHWTCCTWNSPDIPEGNTLFTLHLVPKTDIHEQHANWRGGKPSVVRPVTSPTCVYVKHIKLCPMRRLG